MVDYIKTASISKTRLYLLTKKKSANQKVLNFAVDRVGCESPLFVPSDSDSDFNISNPSLRKLVFPAAASTIEEELSEVDLPVHTLIRGSTERSIQKDECDRLFEESLEKDRQKDEELTTLQSEASKIYTKEDEGLKLQRIRKRRFPPEPTLAYDHIVLSVRHAWKDTMRRIFLVNATMNNVYDWVGASSIEPMYLELFVDFHPPIPATDPTNKYVNTVLNRLKYQNHLFLMKR